MKRIVLVVACDKEEEEGMPLRYSCLEALKQQQKKKLSLELFGRETHTKLIFRAFFLHLQ